MYIEKLEIKGFGKIKNLTLELTKGMNIIYGGNESGKSTLQWFLKGMLYGLRGGRPHRDEILPPLKRFKPWKHSDYGGVLEYRLDNGSRYRVERNFESNSARIYDGFYNEITGSFETGRQKTVQFAEKHMGLNELCFDKTVFIGQMESRIDEDAGKELVGRLVNVSQTGFEDVSFRNAQKALKEALKSNVGTGRTSTRPLDKVAERLEELESLKKGLIKKREDLLYYDSSLNQASTERKALEEQKQVLLKIKELLDIRRKTIKIRKEEAAVKEIINCIYVDERKLENASGEFRETGRRKAELLNALEQERMGQGEKRRRLTDIGALFFIALAALFTVLGFVYNALSFIGVFISIVLAAAAAAKNRNPARRSENPQMVDAHRELQVLNEAYERKMLEIMKLKDTIKDRYGQASLLFGRQFENSGEIINALNKNLQDAGTVERSYKDALDRLIIENMDSSLFKKYGLDQEPSGSDLQKLENLLESDIDKTDEELKELLLKVREYETLIKSMTNDSEDLQGVDEEIDKLKLKKSQLEDMDTSLKTALEVLTEASTELQRDYAPALNNRMSEIIKSITSGKYLDLKADDSLLLKTVEPETGEIVNSMLLSGGTVDQIYLALRLAMAGLINESQEKLPLIMDEVFSQYDDKRTEETFRFLMNSYPDRQIVLFTCKSREVDVAVKLYGSSLNVINLAPGGNE